MRSSDDLVLFSKSDTAVDFSVDVCEAVVLLLDMIMDVDAVLL